MFGSQNVVKNNFKHKKDSFQISEKSLETGVY